MTSDEKPLIAAATVLLLRDGPEGVEVFMVVRHHAIDSFSGALVFPGGKVDEGDWHAQDFAAGAEGLDDRRLAFRVAAIREAFEECGVLLARGAGARDLVSAARAAELGSRYRAALLKGELGVAEMCRAEDLRLAVDHLQPFAHWITPNAAPKVFDTHFYLALAPADHVARHDGDESTDSVWIRPADAVAQADAGERTVVFPTRMNLLKLARAESAAAAITEARAGAIVTVRPEIEQDAEGRILRIPPEAGYDGVAFRVGDGGVGVKRIA